MQSPTNCEAGERQIGWFPYVVSLFSFIPLLGIPVGIVSLIYGIKKRSRFIPVAGIVGIFGSIILYGGLYYANVNGTGVYGELQEKMLSEIVLPDVLRAVEYYKVQNGSYPDSLENLDLKTRQTVTLQGNQARGKIHYELSPDKNTFHLFAAGKDLQPGTGDDIFPKVEGAENSKSGYRLRSSIPPGAPR